MKAIFSEDDAAALTNLVPASFALKGTPPPLPGASRADLGSAKQPSALKLEGNICEHAIRKFRDDDDLLKEERLLHRATAKWALVVFRYARELGLAPETEEEIIACFGTRSVHTITKRANTFAAYLRWVDVVSNSNVSAFCDAAYWKYLKFLESSGAAASSATSFLASARFCKFVLGLSRVEEPSRKCAGLAEKLAGQAGVVRQAAPLTVDQILVIHEALHSEHTSRWDRAFCAYCLVALYGRARHSDLKRVSHIEWDVPQDTDRSRQGSQGYIIIYTKHHKTSRATAKKLRLLPIVIPVAGIHSRPWIHAAQDAFVAVNLTLRGEVGGPLFRPPRSFDSLSLCRRSITSDEVSVFVRLLLGLSRDAPSEGDRVTSHSMKRTCLSWASKAGFDRLTRSCLGRHAYATEGTEAIYSVELSLPHVQKLEALIKFIVNGSFAPDASRALMWAFPPPAAEIASPGHFTVPVETSSVPLADERSGAVEPDSGDEGQSSSSTSSSSSSSESDSDGEPEGSPMKRRRAALADDKRVEPEGGWVVHRRSHILHRVYRDKILMCGRPRTQAYDLVEDVTSCGAAMTSLVESEAHFVQRAAEVRLSDASVQALRRHGFRTLGQLAYTVGQPGQLIPEAEFTDWCRNHVPAASAADLASLKRLLFEAQTLALTQLRAQVTEPDSASKRVPEAERERRLQQLRDELSGLNIEGPLEPGRKLLDECSHQEAVGQLKYLSPDKCVSRLHEVTHAKDSSRQVEIDQSRLIIKETQDEFSMPASSALQVQEALRRRGLAYTFAQAVSWNAYDKYVTKLFGHMHRDPPPNHNRISVSQIVEADRLVFTRLIELNIKPKQEPSGARPMDEALHAALESYQVSFALMHLASKGGNTPRRPWKRPRVQPDAAAASVNPETKKGKGKGKKGKAAPWISIPKFIRDRGGVAVTPAGEPICFTYSIHGKCNTPGCTRKHAAASGCVTGDAHVFQGHGPVKLDPVLFSGLCEEFGRQVPFVDHPAEALARTILDSKSFEFTCIAELVSLLPSEAPARSDGVNPGGHSWTSGAYVLGGNLGARLNMKLFPAVSALLAVVLRAACDDAVFTSLALLTNQSAWLHRDLNNACESLNTAVALSSFSGGGIWVQGGGTVQCPLDPSLEPGCIHSFADGVVQFDSHSLHCTQPWAGTRCILVGFVVKGYQAFSPDLIGDLLKLGFNLPDLGTGDVFAAPSGVSSFPVVLEIFSGAGRLTAQLRARGASGSLAVDSSQVSAPAAPPKVLDVATNQQLLSSWLEADHVVGVHFAPPVVMPPPLERAVQYLVSRAVELALLVSIELPANSTFWSSAAGRKVRSLCPYLRVFPLADCADANASSLLVSNRDVFDGFATAAHGAPAVSSEAAQLWDRTYTWEVAAKLADGFVPRRFLFAAPQVASTRAATMSQPKASKFPALVSEHQQVLLVRGHMDWPVARMERLKSDLELPPHLQCPLRVLPAGAQLLRVTKTVKKGVGSGFSGEEWVSAWGVPRDPQEFVAGAIRAGHPCKWEAALPQVLQDAIQRNASSSAEQLARDRALFFKTWLSRAKELESEEASFKASLAPHVSSILAPKRLLLFKELLSAYEYPDPEVFDEITRGIRLTGQTPNTGIFPPTFKPAVRQAVDLEQWAPGARSRVLECIKPQGDVDAVVHEKTVEEREKGWATGPIPLQSLPQDSLISRRFGLRQGEKIRLVDDLSFSGVNELVTVQESPKPHGPDVVAAAMLTFMRLAPGVPLQGRPYDLRSAYRQLPVHPESLRHSYVAHWNPTAGSIELDQLLALPFGASRSVFGFLRVATAVWWLGCVALSLCWSVFFDDFITIAKSCDIGHTEATVCTFFRLLGWLFDECGSKAVDFSTSFKALGVLFNLAQSPKGLVTISNTPTRITELTTVISTLLASRKLTRAEAQRLRGRMQFCDSFLFGRASRLSLQAVSRHVHSTHDEVIDGDLWDSLLRFHNCLQESRPHVVTATHQDSLRFVTALVSLAESLVDTLG
ncbi:unnamed protein product [Symbiodinium sp. CCMP2592]|nr:unnamed protein product [Symbiodinium sp. CCMP2592]